ncbi:MAG: Ku protein [bacterium]
MPEPEGENGNENGGGVRPIWSGTISFGLVNVPVNLYPALRPYGVRLRMLDEDGTPLSRKYACPADGKQVDSDEIVRGYEIEKGKFITIQDEELEALEPQKSRDIDLRQFVDAAEIEPFLFKRPYFITPSGGSNKAYRLLARVMDEQNKAGVATFVMRDKEYLVAILSEHGILRAEILRFVDEVRLPENVGLPEKRPADPKEVARIEKAIRKKVQSRLSRAELKDRHTEKMLALIRRKLRENRDVVRSEPTPEAEAEVVDLMAVLREKMARAA